MKLLSACLMLVPLLTAEAQTSLSLNGNWKFQFANGERETSALEGFSQPAFDAQKFRPLPVPSNWALHGYEEPIYGQFAKAGEGFYRHEFSVPEAFAGKRVLLHFGGVWSSAEVWLNGTWIGRHDSGFTSFAFDVSPHLRAGGTNLLAVRVRQHTRDYSFDANDDWSLGGIFRDVGLEAMPATCYIERVETTTTFDAGYRDADLLARILVSERRGGPVRYTVRLTLTAPDGSVAGEARVEVNGHPKTGRDTLLKLHVPAALHWTAETPHLYRVRAQLEVEGAITHEREHQVGFREVSTKGGVLRVNGQPIKLRGVCRHDEHPDVGIATRREHWLEDLRLMKQANINAIRTVHYPPNQGFIDLCDQMGFYLIEEIPLGYGGDMAEDPSYAGTVMLRAFETLVRDRNHPSVIVWSVGNENPITALHLAAARYVNGADPTRPTLFPWHPSPELTSQPPSFPGDWMPPEAGILAPHYPTSAEALAMTARANRPVIATEYAHAWAENRFGDFAAIFHGLTAAPSGAGGMIWMWQDQGLHVNGRTLLLPAGQDGIVRSDRTPQRDYWETKAVYAPVSVPIEKIEWQPGMESLRIPVTNDFDFSDLSAVRIRWRLMAGDGELAAGDGQLAALPHTTGWLNIPAAKIPAAPAAAACYVQLTFQRADSSEMTTRSVEILRPPAPPAPHRGVRLSVHKARTVTVSAGAATYEFDPQSARLTGIAANGKRVARELRLTLWRPLDRFELMGFKRYGTDATAFPDLDRYTTTVEKWNVETTPQGVVITARAQHRVGDRDRFAAEYRYTVSAVDGSLGVEYTVVPTVQAPWLPEAGMELQLEAPVQTLRWLGLGPLESVSNLKAATTFGQWTLPAGDERAQGFRSGVRWAAFDGGLRVEDCGYFRLGAPGRVRILSAVDGRGTKFRRAEKPEDRLDLTAGKALAGSFRLRVVTP
jgi:beta-galactosidase